MLTVLRDLRHRVWMSFWGKCLIDILIFNSLENVQECFQGFVRALMQTLLWTHFVHATIDRAQESNFLRGVTTGQTWCGIKLQVNNFIGLAICNFECTCWRSVHSLGAYRLRWVCAFVLVARSMPNTQVDFIELLPNNRRFFNRKG